MNRNFMKIASSILAIVIVAIVLWLSAKSLLIANRDRENMFSSPTKQYESTKSASTAQDSVQRTGNPTEDPKGNHALLINKLSLERYGALASVALRVKDDKGNSIPQADVHLYFTQPTANDPEGSVKGKTDSKGMFAATKKTNYECSWEVSKDGYHASSGSIKFSPFFPSCHQRQGNGRQKR